jgi:hypothetical protein
MQEDATPWDDLRQRFRKPWGWSGVYWLFDRSGRLLYIGAAENPYYRWKHHAKHKSWWPDVDHSRTEVEWVRGYREVREVERAAIRRDNPLYNVADAQTRIRLTEEFRLLVRQAGGQEAVEDLLRRHLDIAA